MEMNKLYIIGAGGFGREVLQWIKDINKVENRWEIGGFIDDDLHALDNIECDYGVVGTISDWQPKEDEEFVLCIASPKTKQMIAEKYMAMGAKFPIIVHPTAVRTDFTEYGEGTILWPNAKISVNSKCGKFCTILSSDVGHDNVIGDYCFIAANTTMLRNIVVGDRVFIASNAVIANDVKIGDDAYIGMGSIVMKDIPEGCKTFANPARILPA
jgi:sugar O-acyltransferase (sialic acid O-acetyltransferase NeuD family)